MKKIVQNERKHFGPKLDPYFVSNGLYVFFDIYV